MSLVDVKSFPPTLKKLVPYLARANEVSRRNPNVAYFCMTYALEMGVKLSKDLRNDQASMTSLVGLMDQVEKMKEALKPNVDEGRALMELYSLKIFKAADDKEHSGDISKATMLLYLMSSYLMETTKQFEGGMSPDIFNKQKYARWRAIEIRKHLKGGVMEPAPPRETDTKEDEPEDFQTAKDMPSPFSSQQQQQRNQFQPTPVDEEDPLEVLKRSLEQDLGPTNVPTSSTNDYPPSTNRMNPPTTNNEQYNFGSQPTVPSQNLPDDLTLNFLDDIKTDPNPPQKPNHNMSQQQPKNEDDNPLPFWMREENQQQQPKNVDPVITPPSNFDPNRQSFDPPNQQFNQRMNQNQDDPYQHQQQRQQHIPKPKLQPKPQPIREEPKIIKPKPMGHQITSKITKYKKVDEKSISMKSITEAQKLSKYAASSLQFNDIQAARKYLIDALNLLGGF